MRFAFGVALLFWGILYTCRPQLYRRGVPPIDQWMGLRRRLSKLSDRKYTQLLVGPRLIIIGLCLMVWHVAKYGWNDGW